MELTPPVATRAAYSVILLLAAALCMTNSPAALAPHGRPAVYDRLAVADGQKAVSSGRQALKGWWDYPWYDSQTDGVRRVVLPKEWKPWAGNWSLGFDVLKTLAWIVLGTTLLALVVFLIKVASNLETRSARAVEPVRARTEAETIARGEALPFLPSKEPADFLRRCQALYEKGAYAEAMLYLFGHQLVELDRHGLIRLARGKTNRQYLRELKTRQPLAKLLDTNVQLFERVLFGRQTLDRATFESVYGRLSEFNALALEGAEA